jgi:hypothetical protein
VENKLFSLPIIFSSFLEVKNLQSFVDDKNCLGMLRCLYTRKSTQEGLEQEFNSLDAQREAGEAYIKSQKHENWILLSKQYDDGGFSGGSLERPALHALIGELYPHTVYLFRLPFIVSLRHVPRPSAAA